eukprot:6383826-Prymnesium_polylepis.2
MLSPASAPDCQHRVRRHRRRACRLREKPANEASEPLRRTQRRWSSEGIRSTGQLSRQRYTLLHLLTASAPDRQLRVRPHRRRARRHREKPTAVPPANEASEPLRRT